MKRIIAVILLNLLLSSNSYAASWTKLQDNKHAKLMLDRQSITASGKYQKAWVKIKYKDMQTNLEYPEKSYNNAKLLWYFNCKEQKSATAQVYQLLEDEQIFSAAIDVKRARFIEPVPETEIDLAMRYVCRQKAYKEAVMAKKKEVNNKVDDKALVKKEKKAAVAESQSVSVEKEQNIKQKNAPEITAKKAGDDKKTKQTGSRVEKDSAKKQADSKSKDKGLEKIKKPKKARKVRWKYTGNKGPEFWGDLSPDFASCNTGRNQSPIDISKTVVASPSPLKTFQRFPATDIVNNGHTVQANFKAGNMLAVDGVMYQMKQVHFHASSENTIAGKSFPLEAHFVHIDPKGDLAVLAVMFDEGAENKAIAKLWKQMSKRKSKPKKMKTKVLASELIPRKKGYYRFSGSLTTPPCSEGVIWIVMKSAMTASKSQVDAFKKVMRHENNRPIQPLNGRIVIE